MNASDDFETLEQRLIRALRSHGDAIEPSPDAYDRLARAVNSPPARFRRIRGILGPGRPVDGLIPFPGDSLRPVAFVAVLVAVAGVGAYSLVNLVTSPADTVTAAPANADASDLVDLSEQSPADAEATETESEPSAEGDVTSNDAPLADNAESTPRSSVPAEAETSGAAASAASDPVERFAGLTYAPVRITGMEAAEAFLDLIAVDDVELEDRGDRVVVRSTTAAGEAAGDGDVVTTLTIGAKGDGFLVTDARSDRVGLTVDNATAIDPTPDEIVDDTVVSGSVELSGTTRVTESDVNVTFRSAIGGTVLTRIAAPPSVFDADGSFRVTVPVTGSERAWVVASVVDPAHGGRSLAASPLLYIGSPDVYDYTVVGLPPDDPDGGLVIRAAPNGSRIGVIDLGSTGIRRRAVPPRTVDGLTWWAVTDDAGTEGWVAARYLAVDEAPAETTMVELARAVISAAVDGDTAAVEGIGLGRPVFVGSIVDPRPVPGVSDVETLLATKRRIADLGEDGPRPLTEFFGFDRWPDAEVFVPRGYRQAGAESGARAFFGDLPSVVIRSLNPATGNWERVHLFVSRDSGQPTLVGMVLEAEPQPGSEAGTGGGADESTVVAPTPDNGR